VGMYLPFGLSVPILLGGLIAYGVRRDKPAGDEEAVMQRGVLFASGVIAGESLMGVGLALLATASIKPLALGLPDAVVTGLTLAAALLTLELFRRRCAANDDCI